MTTSPLPRMWLILMNRFHLAAQKSPSFSWLVHWTAFMHHVFWLSGNVQWHAPMIPTTFISKVSYMTTTNVEGASLRFANYKIGQWKNSGKSVYVDQCSVRSSWKKAWEMVSDVSSSSSRGNDKTCPGTIQACSLHSPWQTALYFLFHLLRITILLINVTATYYSVLRGLTFVTCQKGNSLRHHIYQITSVLYFQHLPL